MAARISDNQGDQNCSRNNKKPMQSSYLSSSSIVNVKIPASAAYNFDKMTKINQVILDKLGCGTCHSGHDIRYFVEQNFVVDEKLHAQPGGF
jgi:hypothetical protein